MWETSQRQQKSNPSSVPKAGIPHGVRKGNYRSTGKQDLFPKGFFTEHNFLSVLFHSHSQWFRNSGNEGVKKMNTVFKFNSCTSQLIQDIPNYPGFMRTPEVLTKEEPGYISFYLGLKGRIRD